MDRASERLVRLALWRPSKFETLNNHYDIWLFEIEKFNAQKIASKEQRWLRLLKEGDQNKQTLPQWMSTREVGQGMSTC